MKNKIIAIALAILALSSCQKAFNVSSVRFSKEGGTQTIEVVTYEGVSINDGNANYGKSEYDETTGLTKTTLDWLSVEYNKATNECTVIATKNDSGKKRTFFREAMYGDLLINWNTRNSRHVNSLFIEMNRPRQSLWVTGAYDVSEKVCFISAFLETMLTGKGRTFAP